MKSTQRTRPGETRPWGKVAPLMLIAALLLLLTLPPYAPAGPVPLDRDSTECLSCHGKTTSFDTANHHPVGIDYMRVRPGFKEPVSLDPAIRLINGRIGCATCHIPYGESNHRALAEKRSALPAIADPLLTVDNRKSQLCLACHSK